MAEVLLEVCVDSPAGLEAAVQGGADRIELCSALEVGGLTPSAGLMAAAAGCGRPVMVLIRPRSGDFGFSADDLAVMLDDIAQVRAAGLAGVVIGAMRGDALDAAAMAAMAGAASGLEVTLHRAVDLCADPLAAVDMALALGIGRILSSGGAASAVAGLPRLRAMTSRAGGRLSVMPGGGVSVDGLGALRGLGMRDIHASCSEPGPAAPLGFGAPRVTSAARVRALKAALLTLGPASG